MTSIEYYLLGASVLLLLSIFTSKLTDRFAVPAYLLFLLIGMLAGSEGLGGIYFDNHEAATSIGVLALAFILFSGGLDTRWDDVRPVLGKGLALSTLGVFITAFLVGAFVTLVFDFSLIEGLLLGSVVSSTDAAAVFGVLRSKKVSLKGRLKPLLEFESGSNDPMAVLLTIGFTSLLVKPETSPVSLIPFLVRQLLIGAAMGYGIGKAIPRIINRLRLTYEGLYPVLTIAMVLFIYGGTSLLGGNGFLAVYAAGLVIGNSNIIQKKSMIRFHDGIAWLMQIAMFLTLGLLVFPSRLVPIAGEGMLVSMFLVLAARPAAVFLILLFTKMNVREKLMVSWVGLRGSVPITLATFPLAAGIPRADMIFNIVFFIVLTSALLQGMSIPRIARWLGVAAPLSLKPRPPLEFDRTRGIQSEMVEIEIPERSPAIGRQVVELGLPRNALIVLVRRNEDFLVPGGGTIIESGDALLVLACKEDISLVRSILG